MAGLLLIALLCTDIFETEEQEDFDVILSDLAALRSNPIDLNSADVNEFLKIPFLNISDCLKIIGFREKNGLYNSIEDLRRIPGFSEGLIRQIEPYMTIRKKAFRFDRLTSRLRFRRSLEDEGNDAQEYFTRTQAFVNDYNIYLVTEKDPHETSFLDYYGAGILIDEDDGKRKFALGKYNLDLGSGVMLSSVGSFFSGTDFQMMTNRRGFIPYTSVLENGGYFGAALSDSLLLNYTLFYSNQKLDGRVDALGFARSFDQTGDHVDSASAARKDRINEEIAGFDVECRITDYLLGSRGYYCRYEPAFACDDSFVQFYGSDYWMTGLTADYFGDQFVLFSEMARGFRDRIGAVFGLSSALPYDLDFNVAAKYFPVGYYSPKGIEADEDFSGITFDAKHHSKIVEIGSTLEIENTDEGDSSKYRLKFNLAKDIGQLESRLQLHWRFADDEQELSGSRVFMRVRPLKMLYFDLRLEQKYVYEDSLQKGLFGSFEAGMESKTMTARARFGMFDTDSYSTRVYVYEPDLPGIITNRSLHGKGQYGFIYLGVKPIAQVSISAKYSAVNVSKDSLQHEIGVQADMRW